MRIVLDTNVFISGIFFTGPPHRIIRAWRDGRVRLCVSTDILREYVDVAERLAATFPPIDLHAILSLLTVDAELHEAPCLPGPVSDDPDDDKFLACALAARSKMVVSGDRDLLRVTGYEGIEVMRPRVFVDRYLGLGS